MTQPREDATRQDATVPTQPEAVPPMKKKLPIIIGLSAVVLIVGISNVVGLAGGKKGAPKSTLPQRPAASNPSQVQSFQAIQTVQAQRDQEDRQKREQMDAQMQALQAQQAIPGPEADAAAPMTSAQRAAIYGDSPNAPKKTSNVSQAQAEAKQRSLAREKQRQDALNSDTVAIDFSKGASTTGTSPAAGTQTPDASPADVLSAGEQAPERASSEAVSEIPEARSATVEPVSDTRPRVDAKSNPMGRYDFDAYQGRLYRVFEGTVFEGVVTNHIDGGFPGPILVMLTTDYYSHDHQQLLLPQGTRLIGTVGAVGNQQQRKLFVSFQRAVCPDGFSIDLAKYVGLDPLGTTGLATNVNHGYLSTFAAAAAIGGLGGLSQVGNNGSVLQSGTEIRNGITSQTSQESEQILNHFLNRLPVITLKEGSRARVYIGTDILIPSYAEHRVDPTL